MVVICLTLISASLRGEVIVKKSHFQTSKYMPQYEDVAEYYQGSVHRRDSLLRPYGSGEDMNSQITDLNLGQVVFYSNKQKEIYQKTDFPKPDELKQLMNRSNNTMPGLAIRSKMDVQTAPEEKVINGFHCRHYIVTTTINLRDANNEVDYRLKIDSWRTDRTAVLDKLCKEETRFWKSFHQKTGGPVYVGASSFSHEIEISSTYAFYYLVPTKKTVQIIDDAIEKVESLKGYPVLTEANWFAKQIVPPVKNNNPPRREKPVFSFRSEMQSVGVVDHLDDLVGGTKGGSPASGRPTGEDRK